VIGSLLFVLGACINVLQIVQARSLATLQLMNLTANISSFERQGRPAHPIYARLTTGSRWIGTVG
jgi:hypothetical protein